MANAFGYHFHGRKTKLCTYFFEVFRATLKGFILSACVGIMWPLFASSMLVCLGLGI